MKKFSQMNAKEKIILLGAGGVILVVGGVIIGKKIGIKMGQVPKNITSIWKDIDEEVFVEVAGDIEEALIDNNIKNLNLERSWEVAEGVVKKLSVTMETIE